jgi:hypothetical protein
VLVLLLARHGVARPGQRRVLDLMGKGNDYDHDHEHEHEGEREIELSHAHPRGGLRNTDKERTKIDMKLKERIEQVGATGYILLWLLGIPIPILFLFFLLRGCT